MLVQLNANLVVKGATGDDNSLKIPRINPAYDGVVVRNVGICLLGGVVTPNDFVTIALVSPRAGKAKIINEKPNGVIYWKQYGYGWVDEAKWLDETRWVAMPEADIQLEWQQSGTGNLLIRLELLIEEVKIKDVQQVDYMRNQGWAS